MNAESSKIFPPDYYISGVLAGDISVLSRAITLIESTNEHHRITAEQIIDGVIAKTGNSFRLGITGVPGVGKSTFIESFGLEVINNGFKVAVLAIDPSSQKSKGSILGDKTRMEKLSVNTKAYIRPSPSSGSLGGVARKTYEAILLCEAAGFDFIIVETVGVGQSEIEVNGMVDFFLLLMLAGAGDDLQGIKRGIMEMADALVITKSDGDNVKNAKAAAALYSQALHLFPATESGWQPRINTCSSLTDEGIKDVFLLIDEYKRFTIANNFFFTKRKQQQLQWFRQSISEMVLHDFYSDNSVKKQILEVEKKISENKINPHKLASELIFNWRSSKKG